jgi:hypothetical protein
MLSSTYCSCTFGDDENELGKEPEGIQFICSVNDGQFEELVVSYGDLLHLLESEEDWEANVWKFHQIMGHQGPLTQNHKDYNGLNYNVMIEWENGRS